jgi:hypothetical protein
MSHLSCSIAFVLLILFILGQGPLLPFLENGGQIKEAGFFNQTVHPGGINLLLTVNRFPALPDAGKLLQTPFLLNLFVTASKHFGVLNSMIPLL